MVYLLKYTTSTLPATLTFIKASVSNMEASASAVEASEFTVKASESTEETSGGRVYSGKKFSSLTLFACNALAIKQ